MGNGECILFYSQLEGLELHCEIPQRGRMDPLARAENGFDAF